MTIISNPFAPTCLYLPPKYTISTLQSVYINDNQYDYGCILKFRQVSINKISITLLLCFGKELPQSDCKTTNLFLHSLLIQNQIFMFTISVNS